MAMRYAVSNWIYGEEALAETCERLARLGFDGIELRGEPDLYEPGAVRALLTRHGLTVPSICGMYPGPDGPRDLSHPDPAVRAAAVRYVARCAGLAGELGAGVVIVTPNPVGKTRPLAALADEWRWAVDAVREAATAAEDAGVRLAIEPINRYETYLITSMERALAFVRAVDHPRVGVMLDTFHANIEDPDVVDAARAAGLRLLHVHVADSNRQGVGRGHIDFRRLLRALVEIGYDGALVLEPLPPLANPYEAMAGRRTATLAEQFAAESLALLRLYERTARPVNGEA
jgi:sugar phosphate isomerase/epimerase